MSAAAWLRATLPNTRSDVLDLCAADDGSGRRWPVLTLRGAVAVRLAAAACELLEHVSGIEEAGESGRSLWICRASAAVRHAPCTLRLTTMADSGAGVVLCCARGEHACDAVSALQRSPSAVRPSAALLRAGHAAASFASDFALEPAVFVRREHMALLLWGSASQRLAAPEPRQRWLVHVFALLTSPRTSREALHRQLIEPLRSHLQLLMHFPWMLPLVDAYRTATPVRSALARLDPTLLDADHQSNRLDADWTSLLLSLQTLLDSDECTRARIELLQKRIVEESNNVDKMFGPGPRA